MPDVVHDDLQRAYRHLVGEGFEVSFGPRVDRGARIYATSTDEGGLRMELEPAPHVAGTRPGPGESIVPGGTVVILGTECPGQTPTCL